MLWYTQLFIFVVIFIAVVLIKMFFGIFGLEDWLYSGRTLKSTFAEKRKANTLYTYEKCTFKNECILKEDSTKRHNKSENQAKEEIHTIFKKTGNGLRAEVGGEIFFESNPKVDVDFMVKQAGGESQEGKLFFYFDNPIDTDDDKKNVYDRNLDKTLINKICMKYRKLKWRDALTDNYYGWSSEYLLSRNYYEPCLRFFGVKKKFIIEPPSFSIDLELVLQSIDRFDVRMRIIPTSEFKTEPTVTCKVKSNFALMSPEQIKLTEIEGYAGKFLVRMTDKIEDFSPIELKISLTNTDYPLGDLKIKTVTGVHLIRKEVEREDEMGKYKPSITEYDLELIISEEIIEKLLRAELLYDSEEPRLERFANALVKEFKNLHRIDDNIAKEKLSDFFLLRLEYSPAFLRESLSKLIDTILLIGKSHEEQDLNNFLCQDALSYSYEL